MPRLQTSSLHRSWYTMRSLPTGLYSSQVTFGLFQALQNMALRPLGLFCRVSSRAHRTTPLPGICNTRSQHQFVMDTNVKGRREKECHPNGREGRPHRPRGGESNATWKERGEQQRHPRERCGKVAPKREDGVGKQHTPRKSEKAAAPSHPKKAASNPSLGWCCIASPPSLLLLKITIIKVRVKTIMV